MPRLVLEARRIAATVIHGLHGRRRAGAGREFLAVPPLRLRRAVAERRLAPLGARRSSLRARAANGRPRTRCGCGRTARRRWRSPPTLAQRQQAGTRADRDVRARRTAGRGRRARRHSRPDEPDREPQRDRQDGAGDAARRAARPSLPPSFVPSALAEIVVLSDFWSPIGEIRSMLARTVGLRRARPRWCRSSTRRKRLSPIPAASSSSNRKAAASSPPAAPKRWAGDYVARVARHRAEIRAETDKLGWLFSIHTTDRSAAELLLFLHSRHDGEQADSARALDRQGGATGMIAGLPLAFAEPLLLLGLLSLPALWWLLRVMPPRPRRIEFPPTRLLFDIAPKEETPSRTPWWLTALAAGRRRAGDHRGRRADLESANRRRRPQRAARDPARRRLGAAPSWDARIKRRRRTDRARRQPTAAAWRWCRCRSRRATSRCMTAGAARVRVAPARSRSRYAIERVETLPAIERFLKATGDSEIVWLSDGVDTRTRTGVSSTASPRPSGTGR